LIKLHDRIRKEVKPKWLNMDYWADDGFKEKKCGTAACVAGWATVFFPRRLELSTTIIGGGSEEVVVKHKTTGKIGFDAFADAFGISHQDAGEICSPDEYQGFNDDTPVTKRDVLKRIKKVAARY